MKRIDVKLTDEQATALAPFFDHAIEEYRRERPGMLIAQVIRPEEGHAFMRVGFCSHESAKLLRRLEADHLARQMKERRE